MTLSGLELRQKACEAIGWTDIRRMDYCGSFVWCGFPPINAHIGRDPLPAIESDPAIAIPELRKLCAKNNWGWRIEETDTIRCMIFRRGMIAGNRDMVVVSERSDSDVAEAVARCLVIASAQEVKK